MPKFKETDNFVVDLRDEGTRRKEQEKSADAQIPNTKYQIPDTNVWNFVQYNNAFLAVLVIGIMAFSGLVFASEDVRSSTIGSKQVSAEGVDNSLLLETDLDEFSMDFTIEGIIEDEEQFMISYSYVDLDITDITNSHELNTNVHEPAEGTAWRLVEKTATRRILKPFRKDLGLYLAGQLSQEAKARKKELLKLQKEAQSEGETKIVQVTQYSGLLGKVLDLSANVFPGYEPVKKRELPTPAVNARVQQRATSGADNLTNVYTNWVAEHPQAVADLNDGTVTHENESETNADESPIETNTDDEGNGEEEITTEENNSEETTEETPAEAEPAAAESADEAKTGEENTEPAPVEEVPESTSEPAPEPSEETPSE